MTDQGEYHINLTYLWCLQIQLNLDSFSDNIKALRSRIVVPKDHIDTNLEAKREKTIGCCWTDKKAREDQMNGDADSSHDISFSNL